MKVLKFGGTSMANASSISLVYNIIQCDKANRFIVVSAPGKMKSEPKVTDLLYACYKEKMRYGICNRAFKPIEERFYSIVRALHLNMDLKPYLDEIKQNINGGASIDYSASRGEFLIAKILAELLGYEFVDAEAIIKFDMNGVFNAEVTNVIAGKLLAEKQGGVVIPGYYGVMPNGTIKTFSRGGSDITGAIVARAVEASVYENWTDVDGFYACDPKIIREGRVVDVLSYDELRELSYMGANILHPESIFPVRKGDIPIHIRNTFNPRALGTLIVPTPSLLSGEYRRKSCTITGVAGKSGFAAVFVEKSMMNSELGFARKVLSVFETFGISIEHMPTSIDTLAVVIDRSDLTDEVLSHVVLQINAQTHPDNIEVMTGLAVIAVVGHAIHDKKGIAARVCGALDRAGIGVLMITQNMSEFSLILAIQEEELHAAMNTIFYEFERD